MAWQHARRSTESPTSSPRVTRPKAHDHSGACVPLSGDGGFRPEARRRASLRRWRWGPFDRERVAASVDGSGAMGNARLARRGRHRWPDEVPTTAFAKLTIDFMKS